MSSGDTVDVIAERAARHGLTVAAAESLTSGLIASRLGAGPQAGEWFAGGVIAYQTPVKYDVLRVREGPVVSATCASDMAEGAAKLFGAEAAVAATGVGGPDEQEGKPPGTVFIAAWVRGVLTGRELSLEGDPEGIIAATAGDALRLLADAMADSDGS